MFDEEVNKRLQKKTLQVRLHSIRWIKESSYGFLGSCLSVTEILVVLSEYFQFIPPEHATDTHDFLILSKGHAAPALYATLATTLVANDERYARLGSPLQGHPNSIFNPFIDVTTGSLGNGLAIGVGIAHGLRLQGKHGRVVVVLGDGELQEGLVWEALIHAVSTKVKGLLIIIDENGFQSNGPVITNEITRAMLQSACASFTLVNGHDLTALTNAVRHFEYTSTVTVVVAQTQRGHGLPVVLSHPTPMSWIPDTATLDAAITNLERQLTDLDAI